MKVHQDKHDAQTAYADLSERESDLWERGVRRRVRAHAQARAAELGATRVEIHSPLRVVLEAINKLEANAESEAAQ